MKKIAITLCFIITIALCTFTGCVSRSDNSNEDSINNATQQEMFSEMIYLGSSKSADGVNFSFYEESATKVMYMTRGSNHSGGCVVLTDPKTGLPLTYEKYMEFLNTDLNKIAITNYRQFLIDNQKDGNKEGFSSYCLYDMDGDGVKDLILLSGVSEAHRQCHVYVYFNNCVQKVGDFSAGHSSLYGNPDGYGLIQHYGHMGFEKVTSIEINDNQLKTSVVIPERLTQTYIKTNNYIKLKFYDIDDMSYFINNGF